MTLKKRVKEKVPVKFRSVLKTHSFRAKLDSQDDVNVFENDIRLNIIQSLIKKLGGELWIKSEHSIGSTFIFTIDISHSFVKEKIIPLEHQPFKKAY